MRYTHHFHLLRQHACAGDVSRAEEELGPRKKEGGGAWEGTGGGNENWGLLLKKSGVRGMGGGDEIDKSV